MQSGRTLLSHYGTNMQSVTEDGKPSQLLHSCTLGVHDDNFSSLDILVNQPLFTLWGVATGTPLRLTMVGTKQPPRSEADGVVTKGHGGARNGICNSLLQLSFSVSSISAKAREIWYVFVVPEMPPELHVRHPNLEVAYPGRCVDVD